MKPFSVNKKLSGVFSLLIIFLLKANAQTPAFSCYITNDAFVAPNVYQFDVYLLNTGTASFEYASGQWGISVNSAVANGGTLTPSIVSGSSQLNANQVPITVQLPPQTYTFNILGRAPPGNGNGTIISSVNNGCSSPGTRVATFQITNSVPFSSTFSMNHVFNFISDAGLTDVKIYAYINGSNTDATPNGTYFSYNTPGTCLSNFTGQPTFSCYITNEMQISSTVYQFDVYLLNTNGAPLQYALGQFGISVNSNVANGGTLAASVVPGSTTLSNISQAPANVQLPSTTFMFNVASRTPPGNGSGSVISNVNGGCSSPGTRIASFQITNTVGFAPDSTMNHVFNFTAGQDLTATKIFAYIGGNSTDITANGTYYSYNTPGTCLQNIPLAYPHFSCYLTNELQVSPSVYQFDLYLLRTTSLPMEYAQGQWGITINSSVANGGTLTPTIVSGSSDLPSIQAPANVQNPIPLTGGIYYFNVAPRTPPGSGSGALISNINNGCSAPGTRVATFQITNSVPFASNTSMDHVFNFTSGLNITQTKIFAYVNSANTDITDKGIFYSYNTPGTCLQDAALNCNFSVSSISSTSLNCFGGNTGTATVTVSGGTAPFFYSWNNGETNSAATALSAGAYSVNIRDSKNCLASASTTVTQPAALVATCNSTNVSCNSSNNGTASVAVSGGSPAYNYQWSNNATTSALSSLSPNAYSVTVSDTHGCSSSCSVTISQATALTVIASAIPSVICAGNDFQLSSTVSGGTAPFNYAWTGPSSYNSTNAAPSITSVTLAAGGTYTLSVADANNCSSTGSTTVTVNNCISTLTLKAFLQGFYTGISTMIATLHNAPVNHTDATECDSITVSLWDATHVNNSSADFTTKTIIHTNGVATVIFPGANYPVGVVSHAWYIQVQHRNHFETWSANTVTFNTTVSYDFSTGLSQAYSNGINAPMRDMGSGIFGFWAGDVNTDGRVDVSDMSIIDNDASHFLFGYHSSDCNGDASTDASDMAIVDNNAQKLIFRARPH